MIQELNQDNLAQIISDNSKVVVQYSATWCGNCRIMKPKFKKLASENSLSEDDFPVEIRSGKKKAKGKITITDVKIKLGLVEKNKIPFASQSAEAFAKDNGISEEVLKGMEGTGHNNRITIGDLRKLGEGKKVAENNNSQMNCKMRVENSSSSSEEGKSLKKTSIYKNKC